MSVSGSTRLERRRLRAVRLAWRASAELARREPYLWRARARLRHLAALFDLVPELVWAARHRGLWVDSSGAFLVAYRSDRARRRTWWLAGLAFALVLVVVLAGALVAILSGVPELVVYAAAIALLVAGTGARPLRTWTMSRDAKALRDHRQSMGPHTYISFIYKPKGARSPLDLGMQLHQDGELVGPYVAQAATPAHVRLYRRYGFEPVSNGTSAAGRPTSRLMMLRGDLPGAGV